MKLRLPWLISRQRLIFVSFIDFALILFSYFLFSYFLLHYSSLNLFSIGKFAIFLFAIIWIIGSYVIGRYNKVSVNHNKAKYINLITFPSTLFSFYIFSRSFIDYKISVYESFFYILPFLFVFSIFSTYVLSLFLEAKNDEKAKYKWLFIGSKSKHDLLKKYCPKSFARSKSTLKLLRLSNQSLSKIKYNGVVVENLDELEVDDLCALIKLKKRGFAIINTLSWFEREQQRIPSEIITKKDLIMGNFYIKQGSMEMRLKRLADFLASILLVIILFPIILIAAFFIYLEDRGPILYSQVRTGIDSEEFRIWKLRTMRTNSEKDGVRWASKYDPRITKIGYFLRKTRIDELPQLISVINGNMSLIGPRPERPEFDVLLEKEIPHYRARYLTRPGLSGWAQVNYPYGSSISDASMKLSYDIYYFRNFSLFLDILILFKTIKLVLNGKGAIPNA